MPPFELPSGPALVRVTLLATALAASAPTHAEEPPAPTEQAAPVVEVEVRASSRKALEELARQAAVAKVLSELALDDLSKQHVALRHPMAELLAAHPDYLPLEEIGRELSKAEDGAQVGRFRFRVDPEARARVEAALQPQWATPVGTVGVSPLGQFIIVDPDAGFLPGDRILLVNGAEPTRANVDGIGYEMPLRIERDGKPIDVTTQVEVFEFFGPFDDERRMAPTCGPCCHGDCGEKLDPGPAPGLGPPQRKKP